MEETLEPFPSHKETQKALPKSPSLTGITTFSHCFLSEETWDLLK